MQLLNDPHFLWVIILATVWDGVWKGAALWKAAKNHEHNWFIVMFVLNTLGILPILYLTIFQKRRK